MIKKKQSQHLKILFENLRNRCQGQRSPGSGNLGGARATYLAKFCTIFLFRNSIISTVWIKKMGKTRAFDKVFISR